MLIEKTQYEVKAYNILLPYNKVIKDFITHKIWYFFAPMGSFASLLIKNHQ